MVRYGIARWLTPMNLVFPYATLTANIVSCIVLGYLVAIQKDLSDPLRLLLLVGFCGGFSTFSTFSNETFALFQEGNYTYAFINILVSVVVCLIAIYIGLMIGKAINL